MGCLAGWRLKPRRVEQPLGVKLGNRMMLQGPLEVFGIFFWGDRMYLLLSRSQNSSSFSSLLLCSPLRNSSAIWVTSSWRQQRQAFTVFWFPAFGRERGTRDGWGRSVGKLFCFQLSSHPEPSCDPVSLPISYFFGYLKHGLTPFRSWDHARSSIHTHIKMFQLKQNCCVPSSGDTMDEYVIWYHRKDSNFIRVDTGGMMGWVVEEKDSSLSLRSWEK